MKVIKEQVTNSIIINKSEFITLLYKVESVEEINHILNEVNKEYRDATHRCYAYIFESTHKCSDDGEPSGTAGLPMLDVLKKNELDHILCIVVRYFGGIKLGAGGLLRAYISSLTEALKKTEIIEAKIGTRIKFSVSYDKQKEVDKLLDKFELIKSYNNEVKYEVVIDDETLNLLKTKGIEYETIKKDYINTI